MKYDCSRTLDYVHELERMCHSFENCEDGCPFEVLQCDDSTSVTQQYIDLVQRWSDEHPEPPKLTRKEHDFLTSFDGDVLSIERRLSDRLYVVQHSPVDVNAILIDPNSFSFISVGEVWYFTKLLNLEVAE